VTQDDARQHEAAGSVHEAVARPTGRTGRSAPTSRPNGQGPGPGRLPQARLATPTEASPRRQLGPLPRSTPTDPGPPHPDESSGLMRSSHPPQAEDGRVMPPTPSRGANPPTSYQIIVCAVDLVGVRSPGGPGGRQGPGDDRDRRGQHRRRVLSGVSGQLPLVATTGSPGAVRSLRLEGRRRQGRGCRQCGHGPCGAVHRRRRRAHANTGSASAIAGYLGNSDKVDKSLGQFGLAYAEQTVRDHQALVTRSTRNVLRNVFRRASRRASRPAEPKTRGP
jgi:Uncharacterized protein conserved in bacteria (DUF2252)